MSIEEQLKTHLLGTSIIPHIHNTLSTYPVESISLSADSLQEIGKINLRFIVFNNLQILSKVK